MRHHRKMYGRMSRVTMMEKYRCQYSAFFSRLFIFSYAAVLVWVIKMSCEPVTNT